MCGENLSPFAKYENVIGSPPRVRGKLSKALYAHFYLRITPACAGKTVFIVCCLFVKKDHPRVCGENTSEMAYFRG